MPSDRSRGPDRTRFGYSGVAAQQGRVILDRDFNAQQSLTADRIAGDALDFVGPCGTPDDGFRIGLIDRSGEAPTYWSPPVSLSVSPPQTPGASGDFLISPGTMYVGGQRVYFPPKQNDTTIAYSYLDQPDWPEPPPASPPPGLELVYLSLEELEVSAVEDPDLFEVALGGPDTTQRLKLLRRIHRMSVPTAGCADAWQTAVAEWAKHGLTFDPASMRLTPNVGLKVGFSNPPSNSGPCDPVATGGYLGNDNQLIRVRIDRSANQPRLLWGKDDASFLYRVANVAADAATLTLAADPPDAFQFPQQGQWVEVLTTASVLAQEPDEGAGSSLSQILRVVAEPNGVLCQVQQPYGPLPGGVQNVLVVTPPLPPDVSNSALPLFVRVWQAAQAIPANGEVTLSATTTDVSTGTTSATSTGVTATLSPPSGADVAHGLFWQIAVRPATPQGVYPEDLLITPQPPDGPRRWVCPLAVIDWTTGEVTDCRNTFANLVALSRRRPGCCTVSIRPGDISAATPLQLLIDRAAVAAARAAGVESVALTVCLEAGTYKLPRTLYLNQGHSDLTLESCGGSAVLQAEPLTDLTPFADGLIVVDGAPRVTLSGLSLRPPIVRTSESLFGDLLKRLEKDGLTAAAQILRRPYTSFGVRVMNAPHLTLSQCDIQLQPSDAKTTKDQLSILADFFGAAVFMQGDCAGTRIANCTAASGFAPTYTPIAVRIEDAAPTSLDTFNRIVARHVEPSTDPPPAASPPPASSPETGAAALENRVSDALAMVAAKRLAGDVASPRFTIMTAGLLAAESSEGYCNLGRSTVTGSAFDSFTFGAYLSAQTPILRLQDNTVSNGVAGLWLELPEVADPTSVADGTNLYYKSMLLFEEYQLLFALASVFPVPTPPGRITPLLSKDVSASVPRETSALKAFSLLLTGNQVDVRLPSQSLGASAALRLALHQGGRGVPPLSSVIVSNNRLYGGMTPNDNLDGAGKGAYVPAALLTMMDGTPCSLTGNVVVNQGGIEAADENAPSLWLVVALSAKETTQLAVIGNVLQGKSDLRWLRRLGVETPATWLPLNADPG